MGVSIGLALFISGFGNFLNAVGYILEKKGHLAVMEESTKNADGVSSSHPNVCTNKMWLTGFLIYVTGSLMHAYALGQGPQSLFTPMQAVTLVCNTILSPIFLPEKLKNTDILATVVIVISVVGAILFGPTKEETYTVDDLQERYGNTPFIVLTSFLFFIAIIGYIVGQYFQTMNDNADPPIEQDGSMGPRFASYFVISYSCFGGLGASYNVLFMKSAVTLLENVDVAFTQFFAYVIVILLVLANVWLEYWKQRALGLFGALYVVPIFQVMLIVGGILVGAVYFEEFAQLDGTQTALFCLSICLCLIGVGVLAASSAEREEEAFERMRSKMASHARFLQTMEIMKDYIKDKLLDVEDDEDAERLRQQRLQAFKETSGIIHHHDFVGHKAKSMYVKRSVSHVKEEEPKASKSFIAGPSQIGGTFGMWRNIRALTTAGGKPDTQSDDMSTHLTVN